MDNVIPETTGEFIRYLNLLPEVQAIMLQQFGEDGHVEAIWQAAHKHQLQKAPDQDGVAGIGNVTERRIENLLSHLSFAQQVKAAGFGQADAIRPQQGEEPNQDPPFRRAFGADVDEVTKLLFLFSEVTSTGIQLQKQFNDTVDRLERLLAQQAERVEAWNAAVSTQQTAEGTQTKANTQPEHQEDQPPKPQWQDHEWEDDHPFPEVADTVSSDTTNDPQGMWIPPANIQQKNRKRLWKMAKRFNWNRAAVQLMCKDFSKGEDPNHLSEATWNSIFSSLEQTDVAEFWHQEIQEQA